MAKLSYLDLLAKAAELHALKVKRARARVGSRKDVRAHEGKRKLARKRALGGGGGRPPPLLTPNKKKHV